MKIRDFPGFPRMSKNWPNTSLTLIPANIRLGEDVLKTSWRRLQCNICLSSKTSWRHNCKTSCKHFLKTSWKTSWRRFRKTYCKYVLKTSWRRLQDALEDEKCYAEDVFKTSSRCLGKQEIFVGSYDLIRMIDLFSLEYALLISLPVGIWDTKCCFAFAFFTNFSLLLLVQVLLIKKVCN